MAKKIEFKTEEQFLKGLQEYLEKRAAIKAAAPEMLANGTDPEALLNELIHPAEELYQLNVAIRAYVGDSTKECIGQSGSIADQAVQRRKDLYKAKAEAPKDDKTEAPKTEEPAVKNQKKKEEKAAK